MSTNMCSGAAHSGFSQDRIPMISFMAGIVFGNSPSKTSGFFNAAYVPSRKIQTRLWYWVQIL